MIYMDKNVTDLADFQENDGESLPITRCPCGVRFNPWDFSISIYREYAQECDFCHRKLYFSNSITIWEVVEPQDNVEAK